MKMIIGKVDTAFEKLGYYRKNGGILLPTKRLLLYLISPVFRCDSYNIFQINLNHEIETRKEPRPKVDNFTLKIISTPQEIDRLAGEGFDIRSYKTLFPDLKKMDEILKAGGILFCIFVGYNLVYAGWIFTNEYAKEVFGEVPYSIHFPDEVCMGTDYTDPKYRGLGLAPYAEYHKQKYLEGKGILRGKEAVWKSNSSQIKKALKSGYEINGELRFVRILIWENWRERSLGDVKK